MIPEIDVWGAANLMLKRHGERTFEESTARAEEARGRRVITGATVWRPVSSMPSGSLRTRDRLGRVH